ncbi:ABC transporter substrate-binding protein [Prauserella endophytica]|uniref:ABC transporter substrate-binding protein n=1 Tax=Prauserella endophytica TaxID=1592324 RepID=A0ABY2S6G6_9PSEU|nr:ABC transporter substrate-binding protein [Prauserella endophytica]PXY33312.1 ABC transporter substrate-binding protein [Prauserella coralliicola]TKG70889.1 ABC transporter substrate-binding protein [Prauserella endophytica]
MIRSRRFPAAVAACLGALVLAACGGSPSAGNSGEPVGDPVAGGTANVIQIGEPRSLDPASLSNAWVLNAFLGNALYGTLLTNDSRTGELRYNLAESFGTRDNGATFDLKLREGLEFTDGTPLNAEAVKFNWDRFKDPQLGSTTMQEASMIASTEVVDARTLKITMVEPVPNFAWAVVTTSLNWVASPKALQAGRDSFDAEPVGAGPYTLDQWTRQDRIELVKNPGYWDAPKPYLDRITLRAAADPTQRINTMISGGADLSIETNWTILAKAEESGLQTDVVPLNGGQYVVMNMRKAPFDDVRARRAIAAALDLRAMDAVVYSGKGKLVPSLFTDSSRFHTGQRLATQDKDEAQRLFDELAADGKRVSFTFTTFPTPENRSVAEAVQAQLSAFRNVSVEVKTVDLTETARLHLTHDFEMMVSSAHFADPEPRLWTAFHSGSRANMSGIADERLDAALDAGRTATTLEDRKAAYRTVQERLIELVPGVFYTRTSPSVMAAQNIHGITQYGQGSLLPEELWIQE